MQRSRLWRRLSEAIPAAPSPMQAAKLRVQCAVLLARHGQNGEARDELTALHLLNFQSPLRELGAWLHYAEGVTLYFSEFGSCDGAQLERAAAMAAALGDVELQALCSAWLAWFAFVEHDVQAVARHALAARALMAPGHHTAQARLAMTLAVAHDFAGRMAEAQAWYANARQHVAAEGDDAGQSAVMFNNTAMRVAQARRESLEPAGAAHATPLMGAQSTEHYDAAKRIELMPDLGPLMRAQLLVAAGEYAAARELYVTHLPGIQSRGLDRLSSSLLADLALCRAHLGEAALALQQAEAAELECNAEVEIDDRAITWGRLAQVYAVLNQSERAAQAQQRAVQEHAAFTAEQQQWAAALAAPELRQP